jgi:hypothetical protein
MHLKDGIAYADNLVAPIFVKSVRALDNYRLWIRFSTGEVKVFDFNPILDSPAFAPLKEKSVFENVYLDYGCPVWKDGEIDISPEWIYKEGVEIKKANQ